MVKTYRVTPGVKFVNFLVRVLIRLGLAPEDSYLLTVRGRKTGKTYSTPVTLVQEGGERWLVAPYGVVGWVRNARATGQVTLSRRGKAETVAVEELGPEESAPVLKKYITAISITRPYFETSHEAPAEAFVAEAGRHPVFRIRPSGT